VEEQRASPEDTAYTKRAIARVLTKAGKANEALKLLHEAILYYQQSDNKEHLAYCQLSRAISYMAIQQWPEAEQDLIQAADYFRQNPNARFEARLYKEYASLAAAQQQWQKAFVLQQQQLERDSYLQQQLLDNRTSALKTQLQTERIQSEKELLAQKNQQQQQQLQDAESLRRWQVIALIFAVLLIVTLLLMMQKQKKLSAQLRDLALLDELTRLPNRRHTLAMAEQLWQQSSQSGQPLAVLALDIDFFKKVNDTFGHQAGDLVLKKVGHCLRTGLRLQDKIGRVGGEEFLLLLPNTSLSQATEIAQRLCQLVAALNFDELAPAQQVTVSIGIAGRSSQQDLLALWHQADTALYQAKQQGRNRAVLAG
jgi:diguanylate cyclase (GGDEF)-like protein